MALKKEMCIAVLHDLGLVESVDAGLQIWRSNGKVAHRFSVGGGGGGGIVPSNPCVQGSTVV